MLDIDATGVPVDSRRGNGQSVRTTVWATLYSPDSRRYRVQVQPKWNPDIERSTVCWSGVNENVFGGMYRSGGLRIGRMTYTVLGDDRTFGSREDEGIPVRQWSTRTLKAEWRTTSHRLVESRLTARKKKLVIVRLKHHLNADIEDWILVYDDKLYRPGKTGKGHTKTAMEPNKWFVFSDSSNVKMQEVGLKDELTGTQFSVRKKKGKRIDKATRVEQTPYNPKSRNASDFLRILTFHQAVGGRKYTGLNNDSLAKMDLSHLLPLNRAVLIGRLSLPASYFVRIAVLNDSQSDREINKPTGRSATFVRIVLPVIQLSSDR